MILTRMIIYLAPPLSPSFSMMISDDRPHFELRWDDRNLVANDGAFRAFNDRTNVGVLLGCRSAIGWTATNNTIGRTLCETVSR